MLLLMLAMADAVSGATPASMSATPTVASMSVTPTPANTSATPTVASAMPATQTPPTVVATPTRPLGAGAARPDPVPTAADSPPESPTTADVLQSTLPTDAIVQPRDPWVKLNRGIFSFDLALDRTLLAPVAHGYIHVVPQVVRYHVTSALLNLGEPLTAVNDLLQLRIGSMGKTVYRFIINSTLGVAGLFDVAKTKGGIPIHISDFGQTLGRYGVKPGPYIMIPVLGPSDLRDGLGRIVDNFADPVEFIVGGITSPEGISLFLLEGIDLRSRADETLKAVYGATDPYAFARSAYTQSRAATVGEATGKQAALPDFDAAPGTP